MSGNVTKDDCRPDWPIGSSLDRESPCVQCGRQPPRGHGYDYRGRPKARWRDYCSNACRQAAYRERKRYKRRVRNERNATMMETCSALLDGWLGFN